MYPTKDQIMATEVRFRKDTVATAEAWKAEHFHGWKDKTADEKFDAIGILLARLGDCYGSQASFRRNSPLGDCYHRASATIHLATPSIVTALHEFAHHLFGHSETRACRWSVHLFKRVFPKSFAKLHFEGHMLRR